MSATQLPIVFRMGGSKRALAVAIGFGAIGVGVMMILKAPSAIAPFIGAILVLAGLGFATLAVISWKRSLPTLEINETGLVYSRLLQGVTRLAWSEIEKVDVETTKVPREMGRDIELRAVILRLKDGRIIRLAPFAAAQEMRDTIAEVLAQANRARA